MVPPPPSPWQCLCCGAPEGTHYSRPLASCFLSGCVTYGCSQNSSAHMWLFFLGWMLSTRRFPFHVRPTKLRCSSSSSPLGVLLRVLFIPVVAILCCFGASHSPVCCCADCVCVEEFLGLRQMCRLLQQQIQLPLEQNPPWTRFQSCPGTELVDMFQR